MLNSSLSSLLLGSVFNTRKEGEKVFDTILRMYSDIVDSSRKKIDKIIDDLILECSKDVICPDTIDAIDHRLKHVIHEYEIYSKITGFVHAHIQYEIYNKITGFVHAHIQKETGGESEPPKAS